MPYSPKVRKLLGKAKEGDKILVSRNDKSSTGILMPCSDSSPDTIVLKLENGYNISVRASNAKVKLTKAGQPVKAKTAKISHNPELPGVAVIGTGGTVASRVNYKTGGVSAAFSPTDLVNSSPKIVDFANIKTIDLMSVMSEDLEPSDWQKIAKATAKELAHGEGVVLAHGTDTMHYTAAALSFMLQNLGKPVVLTGSQRSSDRGSSDTMLNLLCSTILATSDIGEVMLCMHGTSEDTYCLAHRGTKVRKMHTERRDAFRSINDTPLAKVWPDGKLELLRQDFNHSSSRKVKLMDKLEKKVALVKVYPGLNPSYIDHFISKKYKGLVLEGTGFGHVPTKGLGSILKPIKKAIDAGIKVVVTSQCIYGRTNAYVYSNLRKVSSLGAIYGEDMLPEVAYVKLMWVLANYPKDVAAKMKTNIAGELTQKTAFNTFLI